MENIVADRIRFLIHELRNMRDEVSDYKIASSEQHVHIATCVMDSQLLRELEMTTDMIRELSLHRSMISRKRPDSTVRDVVDSYKLRRAVEQLQAQKNQVKNDRETVADAQPSSDVMTKIHAIAEQAYLQVETQN